MELTRRRKYGPSVPSAELLESGGNRESHKMADKAVDAIDYDPTGYFRLPDLIRRQRVSAASIWKWVRNGDYPKPIKLSKNASVWKVADILAWEQAREQES